MSVCTRSTQESKRGIIMMMGFLIFYGIWLGGMIYLIPYITEPFLKDVQVGSFTISI